MVSVQDESDIQGTLGGNGRLGSVQHQQKVCRVGQRSVRLDDILPFPDAIIRSHDHGNLRSQADGFVHIGFAIIIFFFGIVEGQS